MRAWWWKWWISSDLQISWPQNSSFLKYIIQSKAWASERIRADFSSWRFCAGEESLHWFVGITDLGRSVWFSNEEKAICWFLRVGGMRRDNHSLQHVVLYPCSETRESLGSIHLQILSPIYKEVRTQRLHVSSRSPKECVIWNGPKLLSPDFQASILSIDYLLNNIKLLPFLMLWSWPSRLVSLSLRFLSFVK